MDKNKSAERALLRTIEGNKSLEEKYKKAKVPDMAAVIKSRFAFSFDSLKLKKDSLSGSFVLTPQLINKILLIVTGVALIIYTLISVKSFQRLNHIPRFEISGEKPLFEIPENLLQTVKKKDFYTSVLLGRNIFDPQVKKEVVEAVVATAAVKLTAMVEALKVVGISWSETKKDRYVMLEDTKQELTYFLQEGDKVLELTVKEIFSDNVELSSGKETITLR